MFEDALMESGGRIVTRSKYYTFIGALFNGCLLAALILAPLLRPEALPRNVVGSVLLAPVPPPPPPAAQQPHAMHVTPRVNQISEFSAPPSIPKLIHTSRDTEQPPSPAAGMEQMAGDTGPAGGPMDGLVSGTGVAVVVHPPAPRRVIISQGVMAGSILAKAQPVYPAIARAARMEGTVVLSATISKSGTIENLPVLSGPQMLAPAAVDAVRNWRYRPYLLNGEPVEVLTQISVNFKLGG